MHHELIVLQSDVTAIVLASLSDQRVCYGKRDNFFSGVTVLAKLKPAAAGRATLSSTDDNTANQ